MPVVQVRDHHLVAEKWVYPFQMSTDRERLSRVLSALSLVTVIAGCGGGSSSPSNSGSTSTVTSVQVTSPQTYIEVGQQRVLTAKVLGTGNFNANVTWSVNGIPSGDVANGSISSQGVYSAPATLPATNPVTITAKSVQDASQSASTTLAVFTMSINPRNVTLVFGQTQQFTASVSGPLSNAPAVSWSSFFGRIDTSGLYTAPQYGGTNVTDQVFAAFGDSPSIHADVTLQAPTPTITSISPKGASANEPLTIWGNNLYVSQVFFPGPNGTTISPAFTSASLNKITTTVPLGAVSGPIYVQFTPSSTTQTVTSNSFNFTRLPNLRIRAATKDLSSADTIQFTYRLLGASSANPVNWSADIGSISQSGLYQAPVVAQESFATVTGCLSGSRSCDSIILRILPLKILPDFSTVALGKTLQLAAEQGPSQLSANWSVLAGGGSIDVAGLYSAPTNPLQAGGVPISAASSGTTANASVSVTGAFPGVVSRTYDYVNLNNQVFEGTYVQTLSVNGNRLYTLDQGIRFNPPFNVNPPFSALEVWDITDPVNPKWLDAAEAISPIPALFGIYGRYAFEVDVTSILQQPSRVALYDVQSSPPALVSYVYTPDLATAFSNNGVIYGVGNSLKGSTAPIYLSDVRTGTVVQREIDLPLPAGVCLFSGCIPSHAIGTANTIYADFGTSSGLQLAAYDTSVSPPTLLAAVPIVGPILSGVGITIDNNLLMVGGVVFDISNPVPVEVGQLPLQEVDSVNGPLVLGRGTQYAYMNSDNYRVLDLTNPAAPVVKASVFDNPSIFGHGELAGNHFIGADGLGGIATYDVSAPGGYLDILRTGLFPDGFIFDHVISQQKLYVTGASALGSGGLGIFDLSSGSPVFSGELLYGQDEGFAVQVAGTKAFVGMTTSLKTIDVRNPTNPVETGSTPLPTAALALSGNILFDVTGDSRLLALDITNPNSPNIVGTAVLPVPGVTVKLVGSVLFIADGPAGLLIYDVSNPAAPKRISHFSLSAPVWDAAPIGNLVFLAVDDAGLVVADISSLSQPKQLSQTTLESWNPFPYRLSEGPRSVAFSVSVQNGLVYVGTSDSAGIVFAFDYTQPTYPRLVSMTQFGEFVYTAISGFSFIGNEIYVFGALGVETGIVQSDNSAPRNVINLFYPPLPFRSGTFFAAVPPPGSARISVHPKYDPSFIQRRAKEDSKLRRQRMLGTRTP